MLAVLPSARRLGLGTELVRRSILLARCLGFKGCKAVASGAHSRCSQRPAIGPRKLLGKCGLVEEVMVPYESFTLEVTGLTQGVYTSTRAPGPSRAYRDITGSLSWHYSFRWIVS